MKRRWLKALFLVMMAMASFGGPMNPKEIEELLHIMNETKVEFTIPDDDGAGDGNPPWKDIESVRAPAEEPHVSGSESASASES